LARITKNAACEKVADSLREFGYKSVTTAHIREVLDAWLEGKRESELPHGIVGMFAEKQFEECEKALPGSITKLKD
jgi:hypothetical protein